MNIIEKIYRFFRTPDNTSITVTGSIEEGNLNVVNQNNEPVSYTIEDLGSENRVIYWSEYEENN